MAVSQPGVRDVAELRTESADFATIEVWPAAESLGEEIALARCFENEASQ